MSKLIAQPREKRGVSLVVIRRQADTSRKHIARAHIGQTVIQAAIGRAGSSHRKREGDMATPVGVFEIRQGFFRQDRLARPLRLAIRPLTRTMGWCDDVSSGLYNRAVRAGAPERHERLWREDRVYDLVFTTSHNERPRIRGGGSAIFLHLAQPGYQATEGCVAISLADMRRLLPRLGKRLRLKIVG